MQDIVRVTTYISLYVSRPIDKHRRDPVCQHICISRAQALDIIPHPSWRLIDLQRFRQTEKLQESAQTRSARHHGVQGAADQRAHPAPEGAQGDEPHDELDLRCLPVDLFNPGGPFLPRSAPSGSMESTPSWARHIRGSTACESGMGHLHHIVQCVTDFCCLVR